MKQTPQGHSTELILCISPGFLLVSTKLLLIPSQLHQEPNLSQGSARPAPTPNQCLLGLIRQQLRKQALWTTGSLAARPCFYVNPTTFSLQHNRDPLNLSGMVPRGPSTWPFKRVFPQSLGTSPLPGSKKRRGGAVGHPPSPEVTFPSQARSLVSLSAGRLLLVPECVAG